MNSKIDLEELFGGAAEIIGREALERKLHSGRRLIIKHGVDPTARDLHLGYAVNYQVMRRFQEAGHQVVLLIGDYTTRIGDPTGKDKTRPKLSRELIEANVESMLKQLDRVLDVETLVIRRNSEWFDSMSLQEFLQLGTRISAARLWERDLFKRRLAKEQAVYIHEFLYPILQGYDSYMLKSDLTINGMDQRFNELLGREIQSFMGQEPQAIMAMPILPGIDGVEKMSQSLGNYVGLAEPPQEQYGKLLSIPDALMSTFYRLATRLSKGEIDYLFEEGCQGPMELKMHLAREIVAQYHSPEAAEEAERHFIRVHRERSLPDEIPLMELEASALPLWICRLLSEAKLTKSNGEARRTIKGGGLRLDGTQIKDPNFEIKESGEYLIQKGKRHFLRLRIS